MQLITEPEAIERRSFELISEQLLAKRQGLEALDPRNAAVVKRVIHTTADFDYADNLEFSQDAVTIALEALQSGAHIVTDTKMALAGINKPALAQLGCTADCFIDAPEVVELAKSRGTTRAATAVDQAIASLEQPVIFAVGNAPTALIRLYELYQSGSFSPILVIGVPVGFVNVVESKEMLLSLSIPQITARGQKGGSNVAAAIVNALLYQATGRVV